MMTPAEEEIANGLMAFWKDIANNPDKYKSDPTSTAWLEGAHWFRDRLMELNDEGVFERPYDGTSQQQSPRVSSVRRPVESGRT